MKGSAEMPPAFVTSEDLINDPDYPYVAHVPLERLRLDSKRLPPQRRRSDGTPVCLAGDHDVDGEARLCDSCGARNKAQRQTRRREARRPDVAISKRALAQVHDSADALSPLMLDLTVAYNNGGNLRDEMNRVMLSFKTLQRDITTLLMDPREDRDWAALDEEHPLQSEHRPVPAQHQQEQNRAP